MDVAPVERFAHYLGSLRPQALDHLPLHYTGDVDFRDPINHRKGLEDLRAILEDFFKQLKDVRIDVKIACGDKRQGFVRWIITYKYLRKPRRIDGMSHVTFSTEGKVATQTDFWDASHVVYGEFPLLGPVLRLLRRLVRVRPKK